MKSIILGFLALILFTHPVLADTSVGSQSLGYSYTNATATGTGYVKTSGAYLHTVTINKPVASAVIKLSDSTQYQGSSANEYTIGTITMPATLLNNGPITAVYDVQTVNGLTYYTSAAAEDITIAWR
jgi:hypothetical protein